MEELAQAALAAYENYSEKEKKQFKDAFKSLDKNGDYKISLEEFLKHCDGYGDDPQEKRKIFNLIDQNGDGSLQFNEFLTLCHVISSRRPTCDGCDELIKGLYFTCTCCRLMLDGKAKDNYDLCISCYHGRDFKHEHTQFLDNYTFFEMLSSGDLPRNDEMGSTPTSSGPGSKGMDSTSASRGSGSKRGKVKKAFRGLVGMVGVAANIVGLTSALNSL